MQPVRILVVMNVMMTTTAIGSLTSYILFSKCTDDLLTIERAGIDSRDSSLRRDDYQLTGRKRVSEAGVIVTAKLIRIANEADCARCPERRKPARASHRHLLHTGPDQSSWTKESLPRRSPRFGRDQPCPLFRPEAEHCEESAIDGPKEGARESSRSADRVGTLKLNRASPKWLSLRADASTTGDVDGNAEHVDGHGDEVRGAIAAEMIAGVAHQIGTDGVAH